MSRLESTTRWRDFSAGNIQKVSSDIQIPNSVPFSMNLEFDRVLGEAVSRQGTNIVGSQLSAGNSCLGLFNHLDSTTTNNVLFAGFNGTIFDVNGVVSSATGLNSTAQMSFVTFLNTTLMLNGNEARSYTAAGGWVSTGGVLNVAGVPTGANFCQEFKDRVYCAVTDRLYYTNTPTSGSVSWTASGSGSLQVEQEDGGGTLQALNKVPGYLLIYKQRSLKRWNFDSSFPEDLINIGTQSHKSVVRARGKNYFFYGPNGFYETQGGYPKLISRPIQRIVDGIASSFYASVNGWSDNDNIYWSVGTVTMNFDRGYAETYTNVVLRYTIDTQQWAPLRYFHAFRQLHQYISGNDTLIVGGDSNGQVLQLNTGNSDYNGNAITYILQSPEIDFKVRERQKTISNKVYVHSNLTSGAELQARLDYGDWKSIGSLKDIVSEIFIKPLTAKIFEFRIVDSITGEQIKLRGMDFPTVDVYEN
ncbi:MAG: hypothetical protein AAB922_05220 [Patescibacteria group bacterium]